MTTEQKDIITATVPILKENGVMLTKYFYNRMFTHHPELKNLFNLGNQKKEKQQTALALAVLAYAENIANPSVLLPVVDRIGHKHVSLDVRPEQYQVVGTHLIASIGEVLGEAATPAVIDAWTAAYKQLAALMSGHEAGLYSEKIKNEGWSGWRPFKIQRKIVESAEITSFYLYPADGGLVPIHLPGQFISLRVFLPELSLNQVRQYSLSSVPDTRYYRISVKREKGLTLDTNGMISNRLHDHMQVGDIVDLTAPSGNFTLPENVDFPVTFLSGGVGLTPLISMLSNLLQKGTDQPVTWLHGCRGENVHAFRDQIENLASIHENFQHRTFYNEITDEHRADGILEGHLNISGIEGVDFNPDGHYYICGPDVFIQKQFHDLVAAGVNRGNIHFEEFGPQTLALN
ncbi:NO-inducible flavohemoprotein [Mucilaginibacter pocheonensis]|uniref:nitric oxide dioxygenase n=1 Tax=Mucilaginibacter pocheonensis TaxID=398050 RepID=A0ABU1TES1_9SPHI|nr:NO-inducible flavohemoprotein [Mucilaginibacter pocheonensis]MDR6943766.1 nitric oxide dioxygenase [Mucilaginibacter pocheonensis]